MNLCACQYDEYESRSVVCRPCAAILPQTIEDDRGRWQLNPDWLQARAGFATGSKVADIVKTIYKKGSTEAGKDRAWSTKRAHYADHVLAERLTGKPQGIRKIYSLEERRDLEPEARSAYALFHKQNVTEVGFIHHLFIERFGCSPDGLCGHDGMMEIKCLDASTHLRLWEGDESVIEEYKPQIVSGLSCTNRNWLDFVSYCPQISDEYDYLKIYVRRFHRNEDEISALECSVKKFLGEVDDRLRALLGRANGSQPELLTKQLEQSIELAKKPNVVHARKGKSMQLVK
jgi:YqaJ-like recombinase protein